MRRDGGMGRLKAGGRGASSALAHRAALLISRWVSDAITPASVSACV